MITLDLSKAKLAEDLGSYKEKATGKQGKRHGAQKH